MGLKTRFIQENGTTAWLRIYWSDSCPTSNGTKHKSFHNAQIPLTETDKIGDWELGGQVEDYPDDRWPTKCDHCDELVPEGAKRQVFRKRRYNTKSGLPEPGDLYYIDWYGKKDGGGCVFHSNCNGSHLFAILPNGQEWDIDGRASNCTMPKDRVHRCWVQKGKPPNVTVSKDGNTCKAGGGSIASGDYHGFLRNGSFT